MKSPTHWTSFVLIMSVAMPWGCKKRGSDAQVLTSHSSALTLTCTTDEDGPFRSITLSFEAEGSEPRREVTVNLEGWHRLIPSQVRHDTLVGHFSNRYERMAGYFKKVVYFEHDDVASAYIYFKEQRDRGSAFITYRNDGLGEPINANYSCAQPLPSFITASGVQQPPDPAPPRWEGPRVLVQVECVPDPRPGLADGHRSAKLTISETVVADSRREGVVDNQVLRGKLYIQYYEDETETPRWEQSHRIVLPTADYRRATYALDTDSFAFEPQAESYEAPMMSPDSLEVGGIKYYMKCGRPWRQALPPLSRHR